jgi:hypothetical protein
MKKIILLCIGIISIPIPTFAMQKTPAQWYSKNSNDKLMNILMNAKQYGNERNKFLEDVKNALAEGANPNYVQKFTMQNPNARPAEVEFVPGEGLVHTTRLRITVHTTPLYEALQLRDTELLRILLEAGANPDLNNIYVNQWNFQSAREIAKQKSIQLPTLTTHKLP